MSARGVTEDQVDAALVCCRRLREAVVDGRHALDYLPATRSLAIAARDAQAGGGIYLSCCPFCGAVLPRQLSDVRYDVLDELGLDLLGAPLGDEDESEAARLARYPGGSAFLTDQWWRERIAVDPAAFDVRLPPLGSVLEVPVGASALRALVVGVAHDEPFGGERMLLVAERGHAQWGD